MDMIAPTAVRTLVGKDAAVPSTKERNEEILRATRILDSLSRDEIANLAEQCRPVRVESGTHIFSKDEPGTHVYWVVEGRVKLAVTARTGHDLFFKMVEAGEWFGEVSAIEGGPRYADAIAQTASHLLSLERSYLTGVIEKNPRAMAELVRVLIGHIRHSAANIETVTLQGASARVWCRIVDLAQRRGTKLPTTGGIRIEHGLSQQELADSVALTRVMVNRQLSEWRSRGLIETSRGVLVILDPAALEAEVWRGHP